MFYSVTQSFLNFLRILNRLEVRFNSGGKT
jgi:hypothetical protein